MEYIVIETSDGIGPVIRYSTDTLESARHLVNGELDQAWWRQFLILEAKVVGRYEFGKSEL